MTFGAKWGGIVAAGVALVALAACGNPIAQLSTERAVGTAAGQALDQAGLNIQVSLAATPAQLLQVGRMENGDGRFTRQMAVALSRTSLVVNVHSGHGESVQSKQFGADPDNQVELALQVGVDRPVDVRYLGGVLYARADLQALLSEFGQPPAAAQRARDGLAQADTYLPGLAALGAGKWVSINLQQLTPLLKLGGVDPSGSSQYQALPTALLDQLGATLKNNSTYSNLGNHGGRTEYQLNLKAGAILQRLSGDVSALMGRMPIPGASGMSSEMTQAINRAIATAPQTVVSQLWVKDNKLQEVDVDLNQFTHTYPFALPLRVVIASGSPVAAPRATPLQISGIAGILGGLGNLGGASGSRGQAPVPSQAS
jgi:hypothetical protein